MASLFVAAAVIGTNPRLGTAEDPLPAGATPNFDLIATPEPVRQFEFQVFKSQGKPIAGAKVSPWAVLYDEGSFGIDEFFKPIDTDADGKVTISFPEDNEFTAEAEKPISRLLRETLKKGLRQIALRVEHADHPTYSEYIDIAGARRITLVDSTTIVIRVRPGAENRAIGRLYPVLSQSFWFGSDHSAEEGVLTIRRVDRSSNQASRWLRVIEVPEEGPSRFSQLLDLNEQEGNPVQFDVETRPGAKLVGRLVGDVPRPVRNGRIVAQIIGGPNSWEGWAWGTVGTIAEDGKFVLDSLPPDEVIQVIALCDGWVSKSPSPEEVTAFSAEHHFDAENYSPHHGHVHPQLFRLSTGTVVRGIPMERTSTCDVKVQTRDGKPIEGATVSFWPNEFWFRGGAQILGEGIDSLTLIREDIANGGRKGRSLRGPPERFSGKTDALGLATITNLPPGGNGAPETERAHSFGVFHKQFVPVRNAGRHGEQSVPILPGATGRVTVQLKAK